MLANVFFRDVFCHINGGIAPQQLAAGTTSGAKIQLGGSAPIGKLLFRALFSMTASTSAGSGAASLYLATATASGGSFTSISATLASVAYASVSASSLAPYANLQVLEVDTRNEAFANLATGSAAPTWVQPVVVISGATVGFALDVLGWEVGNDPAKNWDVGAITVTETDFY